MNSRGYTALELAVAVALLALAAALMMPSLHGYDRNAQVRTLANQAVTQARQAETQAVALDTTLIWCVIGNGATPQAWQVTQECRTNHGLMLQTAVPKPLDLTGCYRNTFEPNGTDVPGPCGTGATILACIDNGETASPYAIELTVASTGQVAASALTTLCPLI